MIAFSLRRLAPIAGLTIAVATAAFAQRPDAAMIKDEIFARKILMDTVDANMDEIDWMVVSGKPIDLAEAGEHADTISVMLMALPHLFPPDTNQWQPGAKRDPGRDTYASPALWENFQDFYRQAEKVSQMAYAASRARSEAEFRNIFASLRAACETCHAQYVKTDR
ncbi:MAG TPA: cytochrome c [Xanthobacteraceae bacterium]|nr:cytochrome c [Xanthobacteraceae bacterium]